MESRFGTDFSGVKIHAGNEAVQMSRELNAQAFTVGSDIYFNSGKFAPESESGRHLLSHELTHTIQQSGINNSLYSKRIQRVGMGDVQLAEQRKQANAKTLQLVTEGEKDWIKEVLKKNGIPEGTPQNLQNTKFLLHDTSSPVSETSINREATKKGPYGAGVAAYVPREGPADPANPGDYYEKHITRPDFYETKRPSTSEFEKGIDLITQADREAAVKLAWSATKEAEKEPAIDLALSDTGLSAADIAILKLASYAKKDHLLWLSQQKL